jgi:tight adherence protein C
MLYLVAISVALTTGLAVFLIGAVVPGRSRAVRARMAELGLDSTLALDGGVSRRTKNRTQLQGIIEALGTRITPSGERHGALRARLVHAGLRDPLAVPLYLGIRVTTAIAMFVVGMLLGIFLELPGFGTTLVGLWGWGIGWFVPSFVLSRKIAARQKEIVKALPDALDLLVICVEAGLGLNQALVRVAAEIRHQSTILTDEIVETNLQIRAGTPREQALMDMADRTGVAEVRSLTTMLVQTERFGTSIAQSLRVHADTLRTKRKQRAEEAAAKTAIKLLFPLAFCIFPALFVVILGPALITILQTLSGL